MIDLFKMIKQAHEIQEKVNKLERADLALTSIKILHQTHDRFMVDLGHRSDADRGTTTISTNDFENLKRIIQL
jgi:hypothetical protein